MSQVPQNRVLVVDDIDENLKVLSETLIQAGYHPLQAKSGERALQIAAKALPDLILLDIQMPGMDGFETIRHLKANPDTAPIPVIFISALNQIEDKIKGFQSGAVDYVSKPFQKEEVLARVGTHLRLRQALTAVETERLKSDKLLHAMLPDAIAQELKETGTSEPRQFSDATILFSDLVNFTEQAAKLTPAQLIGELNPMVSAFDAIMEKHGCVRIKTIGDAYMAACGFPLANPDHALALVKAALEMVAWVDQRSTPAGLPWKLRVGLHSGDVVAGIVGTSRYLYDVFGDTVNTASRMEAASEPSRINLSGATYELVKSCVRVTPRGELPVKGKDTIAMFFIEGLT